MSFLLECRKVNGVNFPLYFKFSTILAKENVTADKLLTLENWTAIFDELNSLLANANDPSSSKKSRTFEIDHGRLSVKVRWAKISDSSDMGTHIVKILSLSSSSVGKYFLKIDVKLSSYLERIASELEQKSKSLDAKHTSKAASHDSHNSSKRKKLEHRKISDLLPKIEKHSSETPALFDETTTSNVLEELNASNLNKVEKHIPLPKLPPLNTTATFPTYTPEKYTATMTAFHSESSPNSLKVDKLMNAFMLFQPTATYTTEKKFSPTCTNDQPNKQEIVHKPTTQIKNVSSDNGETKKSLTKELFGFSSENYNDDFHKTSSSSSQKIKRKMDSSPRREEKSSMAEERSKSKKTVQSSHESITEDGDISIRHWMTESVDAVLATYSEHEQYLTGLYEHHVKQVQRNYQVPDIPDIAELNIVSYLHFPKMFDFLDQTLAPGDEEKPHCYDVIYDVLVPEWGLAIFGKNFQCSRSEGLRRLRLQSAALKSSNSSQL